MPALQRSISLRGPRFWKDGDKVMFVNHLDGSTQDGPREATKADVKDHAKAHAAFKAGIEPDPFTPLVSFSDPERAA